MNICLNGAYTEGFSYQDNLLPKYHRRLGFNTYVVASTYAFGKKGRMELVAEQKYTNDDGVHVIRIASDNRRGFDDKFRTYSKLKRILEDIHPDIIFLHGLQFRDSKTVANYVQSRAGECKLWVDNHCDYYNSASNWLSKHLLHRVIWRRYARLLEPWVETFWGVLPARVDFLEENYGLKEDKCDLLVMGADDDQAERAMAADVREATRGRLGVEHNEILVVTGGKFDNKKRQILALLKAVSTMSQVGLYVKLLVFGPVTQDLEQEFFELVDGVRVMYVPWADTPLAYDFFSAADLVCFPATHSVYWEQAVGLGKPVLVKRWDGMAHIDCGGNLLYTSGDGADDIQRDINQIVNCDGTLDHMRARAKECAGRFLYSGIARQSIRLSSNCLRND